MGDQLHSGENPQGADVLRNAAAPGCHTLSSLGPLLLYDGACGLCHASVRFVLRHERAPVLRFCSQSSDTGQDLLRSAGLPSDPEALVLLNDQGTLLGAQAALACCAYLRTPWRYLGLLSWFPRPLLDAGYRFIASRRKRSLGENGHCPLPAPEQSARFLTP